MKNLKDRAFETHNEITIRDGRKLIVINCKLLDDEGKFITDDKEYRSNLTDKDFSQYDIIKVCNPITKEIIFDRDKILEELTDVEIMLRQIKIMFQFTQGELIQMKTLKIAKLEMLLREAELNK